MKSKNVVPVLVTMGWLAACSQVTEPRGFSAIDSYLKEFPGAITITEQRTVNVAICPVTLGYGLGGDASSSPVPIQGAAPFGTETTLFTDVKGDKILMARGSVVSSTLPLDETSRLAKVLAPSQGGSNRDCNEGTVPAAQNYLKTRRPIPTEIPLTPMQPERPLLQNASMSAASVP